MADRYEDQYRRDRHQRGDRGFMDRAGDEVRSWFGDDEAERRRQMDDRERGQFRDRETTGGGYGSRSGWYDDRRYGQSGERGGGYGYGSGSGSYYGSSDRGQYGASERSYDYGSPGPRSGYGDRASSYGGDRSYGYGDRPSGYGSGSSGHGGDRSYTYGDRSYGSGDRGEGYGGSGYDRPWSDRPYDRHMGSESFRSSAADPGAAYGVGASWSQGSDRDRDRGMGWFSGRGPKGYRRSDDRINEEVCDRLCDSPEIDATDVEVQVAHGEVTLSGRVSDRSQKRRAEDLIEQVSGVREVHNNLRVGTFDTASPSRMGGASSTMGSSAAGGTGSMAGSTATASGANAGAGNTGEQPGNVLGVTGGADKTATAGRR